MLPMLRNLVQRVRRRYDSWHSHTFVWNDWRRSHPRQSRIVRLLLLPLTKIGLWCGFTNVDYYYVHGPVSRVHVGKRCSLMNTTFNVISGDVYIGDDTFFTHGCYVLTGKHRFFEGRLARLQSDAPYPEVPSEGRDIRIGDGCMIGSNSTILGGVTIGDHVIVGAGAVVTKDIRSGSFVVGVPARIVGTS
jgi:acetyltransferase-like isoleucine patch superfamily enzyme